MGIYVHTELIKHIGVTETLIFSQIHFWCDRNKRNRKGAANGYYWCKRSTREFSEKDFEGITDRTIRRSLKKLQDLGLIVVGKIKGAKVDNTNSYRVDYKRVEELYGIRLEEDVRNVSEVPENVKFDNINNVAMNTFNREAAITISERAETEEYSEYIELLKRCDVTEESIIKTQQDEFKVLRSIKRFIGKRSPINIRGEKISFEEMLEQIKRLEWNHIQYIAERLREEAATIRDVYKYTMSIVYDAEIKIDDYYRKKYIEILENGEEYVIDDEWIYEES